MKQRGIVFVDLDYTLIDFQDEKARELIRFLYGDRIHDIFARTFDMLIRYGQKKTTADENKEIADIMMFLKEHVVLRNTHVGHDLLWSREGVLAYYARDLDPEEICRIVDSYWEQIGRGGKLYPDARPFLRELQAAGFTVFCATASDGRMQFDRVSGLWRYDPFLSTESKKDRIAFGEIYEELHREQIIVCEPWPKNEPEVWNRLARSLGKFGRHVWMVGDSYGSDIVGIKTYEPATRTILLDRFLTLGDSSLYPLANHRVRDLITAKDIILRWS